MSGYVHHPGPERPLPPYGSTMRPAFRTPGDTHGTSGSFAGYAELADDREALAVQLDATTAELATALRLLDELATWCPSGDDGERCANTDAHELLVRLGVRPSP